MDKMLCTLVYILALLMSILNANETPWDIFVPIDHSHIADVGIETITHPTQASGNHNNNADPVKDVILATPSGGNEYESNHFLQSHAFHSTNDTEWAPPIDHSSLPDIVIETLHIGNVNTQNNINGIEQDNPSPHPIVIDQKSKSKHEEPSPNRITKGNYKIRIGDSFVISIYGEGGSRRVVNVDPTGCISYLFVNALNVQGLTIGEARLVIEKKLKSYYKNPLVPMTLLQYADDHYLLIGEMRQAGRFKIKGETTILNALAQSGGFKTQEYRFETYDQADLTRSFLARNGDYYPVDFVQLVKHGDTSQDVVLQNNDYIYISPSSLDKVYILGEVRRPVYIQYLHTISLAEAIAEAGGITVRSSSRVAVIRGSLACPTQFLIDFNRIQKGYAPDFMLEPGDIVFVPLFRFTTFKDIVKSAIRTFVGTVASFAGSRTFIEITPAADNSNLVTPVPTINTLGTNFAVPVTGG